LDFKGQKKSWLDFPNNYIYNTYWNKEYEPGVIPLLRFDMGFAEREGMVEFDYSIPVADFKSVQFTDYTNRKNILEKFEKGFKPNSPDYLSSIKLFSESSFSVKNVDDPIPAHTFLEELFYCRLPESYSGKSFYKIFEMVYKDVSGGVHPLSEVLEVEFSNRLFYWKKWQYFQDRVNELFSPTHVFQKSYRRLVYEVYCLNNYMYSNSDFLNYFHSAFFKAFVPGSNFQKPIIYNESAIMLTHFKLLQIMLHPETPMVLKYTIVEKWIKYLPFFFEEVYNFSHHQIDAGEFYDAIRFRIYYPASGRFIIQFPWSIIEVEGKRIFRFLLWQRFLVDNGIGSNISYYPDITTYTQWFATNWVGGMDQPNFNNRWFNFLNSLTPGNQPHRILFNFSDQWLKFQQKYRKPTPSQIRWSKFLKAAGTDPDNAKKFIKSLIGKKSKKGLKAYIKSWKVWWSSRDD
jgi:hypothetical protein